MCGGDEVEEERIGGEGDEMKERKKINIIKCG